jgi:hypothetical protein
MLGGGVDIVRELFLGVMEGAFFWIWHYSWCLCFRWHVQFESRLGTLELRRSCRQLAIFNQWLISMLKLIR